VRIFLDANILFSAARTDGADKTLAGPVRSRGHELWPMSTSSRKRGAIWPQKLPTALASWIAVAARIEIGGLIASSALLPDTMVLPEKDRPILAAAIHHRCDILVTGDRTHFGSLYGKTIRGVSVLSPAMLAEKVLG